MAVLCPTVLTAMAVTLPILSGNGGIDLSVGPLAGFITVLIGIRTTFLREVFYPGLKDALINIGMAILISLIAAAFVSNIALQPLEQISSRLDALGPTEAPTAGELSSWRDSVSTGWTGSSRSWSCCPPRAASIVACSHRSWALSASSSESGPVR